MITDTSCTLRIDVVTKDTEVAKFWSLSGSVVGSFSNDIIKELADLFSLNDSEMVTPSCIQKVCGHLPYKFNFLECNVSF